MTFSITFSLQRTIISPSLFFLMKVLSQAPRMPSLESTSTVSCTIIKVRKVVAHTPVVAMLGLPPQSDLYCKLNQKLVHIYTENWIAAKGKLEICGWEGGSHDLFPGPQWCVRKTFSTCISCHSASGNHT